jgi:hypothetical protein
MTSATAPTATISRSHDNRFTISSPFFVLLFAGALGAFWPRYLSRLPNGDLFAHVHAVLATIWCGLLVAQPLLIRSRRRDLHRRLGACSQVVAPVFVVSVILLAHHRVRIMDAATFVRRAPSLYLGLAAVVLFAFAYGAALWFRRRPALHARFMIATGLTMIDPVVVRLLSFYAPPFSHPLLYQVWGYGLTDLLLVALLWRPPLATRDRRIFLAGSAVFLAAHLAWFTVIQGPLWVPVASWFRNLPLP